MSQAGEESGNALVEVLDGTVDPSGHLTDTWASKYSYYPASKTFGANDGNTDTEPYGEGIYVGYRYFDSFYKTINPAHPASVVSYPFGYGLSYTHFAITVQLGARQRAAPSRSRPRSPTPARAAARRSCRSTSPPRRPVSTSRTRSSPATGRPTCSAPGKSQTLTLSYDTTQMSSYDTAKSEYVMDAGAYLVRVGDSSRSTHVAAGSRCRPAW